MGGLASAAAAEGATPDDAGGKIPGMDRLVRWHAEATERCAVVLAPAPPPPPPPRRSKKTGKILVTSPMKRAADRARLRTSRLGGGASPRSTDGASDRARSSDESESDADDADDDSDSDDAPPVSYVKKLGLDNLDAKDFIRHGFVLPGYLPDGTRKPDAPWADWDGLDAEFSNAPDPGVSGNAPGLRDAAATARAIASATSVASIATAEKSVTSAAIREASRLAVSAIDAAVETCERQSGRMTGKTSPTDVAVGSVGVVLRAVGATREAVNAMREHVLRARDALLARVEPPYTSARSANSRGGGKGGNGGGIEACSSAAAAAAVRDACETFAEAFETFERDAGEKVVAALQRGLKSLFYVLEQKVLASTQRRAEFLPCEDELGMPGGPKFPGQEPSDACVAVVSTLKKVRAILLSHVAHDGVDADATDPNVRQFVNELARKLRASVTAHAQRFTYSMTGAMQIKRDLGEYEAFVIDAGCDSRAQLSEWRRTLELSGALVIPPDALPGMLAEVTREATEDAKAAEAEEAAAWAAKNGGRGEGEEDARIPPEFRRNFDGDGGGDFRGARPAPEPRPEPGWLVKAHVDRVVGEFIRVAQRRADYHPSMLSLARQKAASEATGAGT